MRFSAFFILTLKEDPQDALTASHRLMVRAGLIRRLSSGSYTWLPIGWRVLRKLIAIIRRRMDAAGALELQMPIVQPAELWQESGRWEKYGSELLRFKDRHQRDHCLAPTHEEVITDLARNELRSYRQLPVNFYQIQIKFRDEIRPRFGVMRAREFLMKDAYSFHADQQSLQQTYELMRQAYCGIFSDCGLRYCMVEADSGAIGGHRSHEFHVLSHVGEDAIAIADDHTPPHNAEMVSLPPVAENYAEPQKELKKVATPDLKTIEQLTEHFSLAPEQLLKTIVVRSVAEQSGAEQVALLLRGDHQLNVVKAQAHPWVHDPIEFCSEQKITELFGAAPGSLGPQECPIPCLGDYSIKTMSDFVSGANQDDFHLFGLNWQRDVPLPELTDLRMAVTGDRLPDKPEVTLTIERGIEVGHIFQLDKNYSTPMKAQFLDKDGRLCDFVMGCYGIGVSRVIAAAIEQNHDQRGIIWPENLAPFVVLIIALNYDGSEAVRRCADELYDALRSQEVDVALDDRDQSAGSKFVDAELIGIPHQIVIGDRGLKQGQVEYRRRGDDQRSQWRVEEVMQELSERLPDS